MEAPEGHSAELWGGWKHDTAWLSFWPEECVHVVTISRNTATAAALASQEVPVLLGSADGAWQA